MLYGAYCGKLPCKAVKQDTNRRSDPVCFPRGTWRSQEFKDYNFNALGLPPSGGHLHPLLKVGRGVSFEGRAAAGRVGARGA